MKIRIDIGRNPRYDLDIVFRGYLDNPSEQLTNIYHLCKNNITLNNVDPFTLYAVNNCIMAFIVKDKINDEKIPKLDPSRVKIYEIDELGNENCIQESDGTIKGNYFDTLMKNVMDDFYKVLNYYENE